MHDELQQLSVLSLNEVRDDKDRMFAQEEYVNIQLLTGKLFGYDACCDDWGKNAHCNAYSSPANSFLHRHVD